MRFTEHSGWIIALPRYCLHCGEKLGTYRYDYDEFALGVLSTRCPKCGEKSMPVYTNDYNTVDFITFNEFYMSQNAVKLSDQDRADFFALLDGEEYRESPQESLDALIRTGVCNPDGTPKEAIIQDTIYGS